MVVAYVGGQSIGPLSAEEERVLARLFELRPGVEFRDDTGKTLSRLVPAAPEPEPIYPFDPELTREELDRRCRESPRMTLADFWKKMGVE